jgi:hypothetical protein
MISTTLDGQSVFLMTEAPDWKSRFGATFDAVSQWDAGLTNREARRPHAATLRAKVRFKVTLDGADALGFASFLRSYQGQPVLLPYWPAAVTWANRAQIQTTGGLRVAWTDGWGTFALYQPGSEPVWPINEDNVAPCLWGRLESRDVKWVSSTALEFDADFVETGSADYSLTPSTVSFAAGPTLSGYGTAPRLFSAPLDWNDPTEELKVRIQREQIGFGRAPIETIYPQTNVTETEFRALTETATDFWSLLRFFLDHGPGASFWCPVWRSAVVMSADNAALSTTLSTTSAANVVAGDYLAFMQGQGVLAAARIQSISGSTLTLATAPGAFAASQTVVGKLLLARFAKPRLSVEHLFGTTAQAKLTVTEVPPEYAPASDETIGTTIGLLTARGFIYELSQVLGGTTYTTRATSYERNLTVSGNTYAARKIDHGTLRSSLFIDRDEVEVRSEIIAADPLLLLATNRSEAPVRVTIKTVEVSGSTGSNAAVIFTGDILSAAVKGSRITAKAVNAGTVFDRQFPRFRLQVGCNHALFSPGCGLAVSDWKFTASVTAPGTAGFPFTFDVGSLARVAGTMPTISAGWFAGGWAEFGAGSALCRRAILDNTAASGGALTLTLGRDPVPFPIVGASVVLYPGCDGARTTCSGKFANFSNFGGHPFLPASNPSLVKLSQNLGGGKK